MSTINITIEARPAQGKTTIAFLIEKALREAGFSDVVVNETEMTPSAITKLKTSLADRAARIAKKLPTIKIHMKQAARRAEGDVGPIMRGFEEDNK
jgi:thymidylate kinase